MLNLKLQDQIFPQLRQALNSERSQEFGRRLYRIEIDDQKLWLKLQYRNVSALHEQSFLNEINQYQNIHQLNGEILAPYQVLDVNNSEHGVIENAIPSLLIVHELAPLFDVSSAQLSVDAIRSVFLRSLEVLEKLHDLGYIHGDLKVEHFRAFENRAVLIDLEQCVDLNHLVTQENTATPRYMAPELFHAEPKSYATDLYAIGIIWLEWLTQSKLQAKTYMEWAKLHCQSLKIELDDPFKQFETLFELLLNKNKAIRCTNFYQIKQLLSDIV